MADSFLAEYRAPFVTRPTAVYMAIYDADDRLLTFVAQSVRSAGIARLLAELLNAHADSGASLEVLARASYHHRPGENGEPDDYDIYAEGSPETCAECVPVLIVRAAAAIGKAIP